MKRNLPSNGASRIIKVFLFLPLTLPNKDGILQQRWLEIAKIEQRYNRSYSCDEWEDKYWVD